MHRSAQAALHPAHPHAPSTMAAKDQDIDTEEEEQVELPRSDVIEKYKIAADIANSTNTRTGTTAEHS